MKVLGLAGVVGALGIQIGGEYVIKFVYTTGGLSKEISQVAVRCAGCILKVAFELGLT
ncbi:hypothetical protein [Facklamia lactis]|uniref:hypothetical protein n=1 Tax=Facklamia lactis TaxID=2749967 RepID=UPI0018CE6EF1|nr:hypothetical protein [Facklamia lactis]MBG9979494.1 hypothetical protein [Facklamia lactis]